jgi:hypothetical protein
MNDRVQGPQPVLAPNMEDPDGFYEQLLVAHEGLSIEQSFELNARLVMLLANQIGSREVLARCIELAADAGGSRGSGG